MNMKNLIDQIAMQRRIDALDKILDQILLSVWAPNSLSRHSSYPFDPMLWQRWSYTPLIEQSYAILCKEWPANELATRAAEMFFHPKLWVPEYKDHYPTQEEHHDRSCKQMLLFYCLLQSPPSDIYQRIEDRLQVVHRLDQAVWETPNFNQNAHLRSSDRFWQPQAHDCLQILRLFPDSPERLTLVTRLLDRANWSPFQDQNGLSAALSQQATWLLSQLHDHGLFTYETYVRLLRDSVLAPRQLALLPTPDAPDLPPGYRAAIQSYRGQLTRQMVSDPAIRSDYFLAHAVVGWEGAEWLLHAATLYTQNLRGKAIRTSAQSNSLAFGIKHLASTYIPTDLPAGECQTLVAGLRAFPAQTLQALLPVAIFGRAYLCEALGWQAAVPLVEQIGLYAAIWTLAYTSLYHCPDTKADRQQLVDALANSGAQPAARLLERYRARWWPWGLGFNQEDDKTGDDPSRGVLDVSAARQALQAAGPDLSRKVLKLFAKDGQLPRLVMLFEALGGWNRADVLARLEKRSQAAVKAYALLPIEAGAEGAVEDELLMDEILKRYLFLRHFERESRKFGPERHNSEHAAVQAALANLAQFAGFPNIDRLEWAMEARLSGGLGETGRTWQLGEYEVRLSFVDGQPELEFWRAGRPLKSVPPAARKDPQYAEIKEQVDQLRRQVSRLRAAAEQWMVCGERLDLADLQNLLRLPIAAYLLTRLVLIDQGSGSFGLLVPGAGGSLALCGADGADQPLHGPLCLAHPYQLHQAGLLKDWQRAVVQRKLVQPFKQVFRELYCISPGEQGQISTARFAGHRLNGGTTSRLFTARNWKLEEESATPYRSFNWAALDANFNIPDAGHYLSEVDSVTTGEIFFTPYTLPSAYRPQLASAGECLPLEQVPPVVFSEALRDADLLVSVAQAVREGSLSPEMLERRGEMVLALAEDLLLEGVSVDERFVHVRGKRASYRIHLGSAAVQREPGEALVIVPEKAVQPNEKCYLPFADAADPRLSEIISKVLLLAHDDRIKDKSILAQLE
jgi:hypothetical protein